MIRLRELRLEDLHAINEIRNEYFVGRGLNLFCPQSLEMEKSWFSNIRDDDIHFVIEGSGSPSDIMGQVSLLGYRSKERKAEFTIFLGERYAGENIGTIATRLMIHYGFTQLNLNKVYLHCYQNNERAIRLYENVGFKKEGVLREFIFKDGKFIDAIHFGMLQGEFKEFEWPAEIEVPLRGDRQA